MDLSNNLKKLREENKFTQEEIANILNITRQSISKWERGISCPDVSSLYKLSQLYNISMESIITGGDEDVSIEEECNMNINNSDLIDIKKVDDSNKLKKFLNKCSVYIEKKRSAHKKMHENPEINKLIIIIWGIIGVVFVIGTFFGKN